MWSEEDAEDAIPEREFLERDITLVRRAWDASGANDPLTTISDISAKVSTNRVYHAATTRGEELIAKTSSYGSYVHFRQDHQLIQQWRRLMSGTRFAHFLAPVVGPPGDVFTYRERERWVVFYEKAPFYDFLPRILEDHQIDAFGRELAQFHRVSSKAAKRMNPTWKTLGSDVAALYDLAGNEEWCQSHLLDASGEQLIRRHCETLLIQAEKLGYHTMPRIPVLVDWNIGNFSVGLEAVGFKLFSRWDYDWFRIEPRTLDFYFAARVARAEGDKTLFSYSTKPLFEARFIRFLRAYHQEFRLEAEDILFLKEAYRFFVLNYVVRLGEHFFRERYHQRLQREALEQYLPQLDSTDFSPLLAALKK